MARLASALLPVAYVINAAIAISSRATLDHITTQQWDSLNSSVHGRLMQSGPFSRPCFTLANDTTGKADPTACQEIQQNYFDTEFRVGKAGSYEGSQWEGCAATFDQCLLDDTNPFNQAAFTPPHVCNQGSVPSYFIDIREPSDAAAGFRFAKQNGVPLIIKNTGHDFNGRSARPNSLALWTNNMKNISFDPDWVGDGCKGITPRPAAILGAGVDFSHLFAFGEANNLTLPGGACPTVSTSGGYVLGGGHSALTNTAGLAADRALQFKVVLPSGDFVTANACQNQDLFFALRGGGGGTFGVVLEIATVALPRTPVQIIQVLDFPKTDANTRAFLKIVIEQSIGWANQGWGGYIQPFAFQFIHPSFTPEQAQETMKPLTNWAKTVNATISQQEVASFVTWWNEFLRPAENLSGFPTSVASRLIPVANFGTAESRDELLNVTIATISGHASAFMLAATPLSFKADNFTSVTPAWRNSLWHFIFTDMWNYNTTVAEKQAILNKLSASADELRKISPNSGAYMNEADVNEPDFTFSFWGTNYDKLVALKKKYDPDHILDCWHCVSFKGTSDPAYDCYIKP